VRIPLGGIGTGNLADPEHRYTHHRDHETPLGETITNIESHAQKKNHYLVRDTFARTRWPRLAWHQFDRRHQSAADETAAVTINADTPLSPIFDRRTYDRSTLLGKVIAVTGRLSEIQRSGNSVIWILSSNQPGGGGINCQIFAGTRVDPEPPSGDQVKVKGRCTGFLMDVNLADCVPEK